MSSPTRVPLLLVTLAVAGLLACKGDQAKPEPSQAATASAAPPLPLPRAPTAAPAANEPSSESVSGTVAETMNAATYTYIRLTTSSGDRWAAVPETQVAVGDKVTIVNAMVMKNFSSPTLKRSFDEILFGTLAPRGATPPSSAAPAAAPASSGAPVAKAPGPTGRTVAEVFAQKQALADKPVTVRGRVVKYNGGILDRNWLHIVDGSGSASAANNDLTVTTKDVASVGDVVLVRGVVHLDKDFGAGYAYPVILEDATLEK